MTMRKPYSLLLLTLLVLVTTCSVINGEEVKEVQLNFWGERDFEAEFIESEKGVQAFVEAVNTADKLPEDRVIKTEPVLKFTLLMQEKDGEKDYHLWFTSEDEGYIQSLVPGNSATYRLDEKSVSGLREHVGAEVGVEKIEF
jgi:hypothetical protein